MDKQYQRLLQQLPLVPTPHHLHGQVLQRLAQARRWQMLWRFGGASGVATGSLVAGWFSLNYLITAISQSGFYYYFSLLTSDLNNIGTYWQELALSLTESLPLMAVTATLALVAAFMWSSSKAFTAYRYI
jgi:hypothetical protein